MTDPGIAASDSEPSSAGRRLDALTGMRYLLALYVVMYHVYPWEQQAGPYGRAFLSSGPLSVSEFFVLSGFVLAYVYGPQDAIGLRTFYRARFARVYPLYALALLLMIPPQLATRGAGSQPILSALASFALVQDWWSQLRFTWNAPGWSLSVELFFYALFPFLCARLRGLSRGSLIALALLACAIRIGLALAYVALRPDGSLANTEHGMAWFDALAFLPVLRLPEFMLGIALGLLHRGAPPLSRTVTVAGWLLVACGVVFLAIGTPAAWSTYVWPRDLLVPAVFLPITALLIVLVSRSRGFLTRVLAFPPLVLLGESSYALYILHIPLWGWTKILTADRPGHRTWIRTPGGALLVVAIFSTIAVLAFLFVEKPLRNALRPRARPQAA